MLNFFRFSPRILSTQRKYSFILWYTFNIVWHEQNDHNNYQDISSPYSRTLNHIMCLQWLRLSTAALDVIAQWCDTSAHSTITITCASITYQQYCRYQLVHQSLVTWDILSDQWQLLEDPRTHMHAQTHTIARTHRNRFLSWWHGSVLVGETKLKWSESRGLSHECGVTPCWSVSTFRGKPPLHIYMCSMGQVWTDERPRKVMVVIKRKNVMCISCILKWDIQCIYGRSSGAFFVPLHVCLSLITFHNKAGISIMTKEPRRSITRPY